MEVLQQATAEAPDLIRSHEQLISLLEDTRDARAEAEAREEMGKHIQDTDGIVQNLRALGETYLHRLSNPEAASVCPTFALWLRSASLSAAGTTASGLSTFEIAYISVLYSLDLPSVETLLEVRASV